MNSNLPLRGKFNSVIASVDGPTGTPGLSFTVPVGTVFKGTVSVFAETNGTNTPAIFGIIKDGGYCGFISYQGTTATSQKYAATQYFELPAGSYSTNWLGGYLAGTSNIVAVVGTTYKI